MFTKSKAVILIGIHVLLIVSLLTITLKLVTDAESKKEGVFKLSFGRGVLNRGVLDPIQSIQAQVTEVVGDTSRIAKQATSAFTQETKVRGDIKYMATSVIGASETLIGRHIPKACSIGTEFGCITFNDQSECSRFPWKDNNSFDKLGDLSTTTKSLSGLLQYLPPLQIFLSIGLFFIVASSSISIASLWIFVFPLKSLIRISLSGLGLAFFLCFAGFVVAIYSIGLGLETLTEGSLQRGFAYAASISTALLSFVHFLVVIAEAVCN